VRVDVNGNWCVANDWLLRARLCRRASIFLCHSRNRTAFVEAVVDGDYLGGIIVSSASEQQAAAAATHLSSVVRPHHTRRFRLVPAAVRVLMTTYAMMPVPEMR
jgi:hypothetical protein